MKVIILILSVCASLNALAHGEDRLGPNGGYVRMPGAYHTEIVLDGKNKLKVYLLDIDWKNPTTKNSSVEAVHLPQQKEAVKCQMQVTYFECVFPTGINLTKKGQIVLRTQRDGQKGNEATYDLPLKLVKSDDGGHGNHH
ncbi:MAG: hypothetical protein HUU57_06030 [Bdellovibrio sp.]|nr:hypothetical protein [Bdellovibrio sp.]